MSADVDAIRARWRPVLDEPRSFDGSADVATLLAALDASERETERLRGERDGAHRAAPEEAIEAAEAWEYEQARNPLAVAWQEGAEAARAAIVADLRALLDAPAPAREGA